MHCALNFAHNEIYNESCSFCSASYNVCQHSRNGMLFHGDVISPHFTMHVAMFYGNHDFMYHIHTDMTLSPIISIRIKSNPNES